MYTPPIANNQLMYDEQLNKLSEAIKTAVEKEEEYEHFYNYLITAAPSQEQIEIITDIRDETHRHYVIFSRIYKELTGKEIQLHEQYINQEPYLQSIIKALILEMGAVDDYKDIRIAFSPMSPYRDIILSIIIEELNHYNKLNYLYILNSTMKLNVPSPSSRANIDSWISLIAPLVKHALSKENMRIDSEQIYQEAILSGVLVGLGKAPQEAIEDIEKYEKSGESKLLLTSKANRGHHK